MRSTLIAAAAAATFALPAFAQEVTRGTFASSSTQINVGGPRLTSGAIETRFLNVQADGSQFSAFAVADFDTAGLFTDTLEEITAATLRLSQDTAGFSRSGNLTFFLASDTSPITPDRAINFLSSNPDDASVGTNTGTAVVGGQLGTLTEIGRGVYTVNNSNRDVYPLTLTGSALDTLLTQVNAGGPLRIVVTPGDFIPGTDSVAATFSGTAPRVPEVRLAPALEIVGVIPEPASLGLLAVGSLALLRRRA